jgi:hypothetical protein
MTPQPIPTSRFPLRASKAKELQPGELAWLRRVFKQGRLHVTRLTGDAEYRIISGERAMR